MSISHRHFLFLPNSPNSKDVRKNCSITLDLTYVQEYNYFTNTWLSVIGLLIIVIYMKYTLLITDSWHVRLGKSVTQILRELLWSTFVWFVSRKPCYIHSSTLTNFYCRKEFLPLKVSPLKFCRRKQPGSYSLSIRGE